MLQFLLKKKVSSFFIFIYFILAFPLSFTNLENIWDLSDPEIPEMWNLEEDHEFERPAEIRVNLDQQIFLQGMLFPLQKGFSFSYFLFIF